MDEENTESLDTSTTEAATETAETGATVDGESQQGEGERGGEPQDWRVKRYGENFKDSLDYHRDTNDYLRKELDKAKKQIRQGQRGIEDHSTTAAKNGADANGKPKSLAEVKTIEDWNAFQEEKFNQILSEREKQANFRSSLQQARREFAGEDGFPSFSELEQEVLAPLIRQNPNVLRLLQEIPDPGSAAMTLALVLKAKTPEGLKKMFAAQGYEELTEKINRTTKEAVRVKGGKSGNVSGKLTPEDIKNMSPEEFEKHVAKMTGRV